MRLPSATLPIVTVHSEIIRRVREVTIRHPAGAHAAREAAYAANGLATLDRALQRCDVGADILAACQEVALSDLRLGFLFKLPRAAAFSTALATAWQDHAYHDIGEDALDAAVLVNIFVVLLDGMLDEVPELGPDIAAGVSDLLESPTWEPSLAANPGQIQHPVTTLAWRVALGWSGMVRRGSGWRSDARLRATLKTSSVRALTAERASRFPLNSPPPSHAAQVMLAKSREPVVVAGLTIPAVRGHSHMATVDHLNLLQAIGDLFGWIDDVADLLLDLNAGVWSEALLTATQLSNAPSEYLLPWILADGVTIASLTSEARERRDRVQAALPTSATALDIVIDDILRTWLTQPNPWS